MKKDELFKEQTEQQILKNVSELLKKDVDSIMFRNGKLCDINNVLDIIEIHSLYKQIPLARTILKMNGIVIFHEAFFEDKTSYNVEYMNKVQKVYANLIPIVPIVISECENLGNCKYNCIIFDKMLTLNIGITDINEHKKLINYYRSSIIESNVATMRGKDFI